MKNKERILIFDIETSLIEYAGFTLFPKSIDHKTIKKDFFIISIAWKWLGESTIHSEACKLLDNGKFCDYDVVDTLAMLVEKADKWVYHNGDKFDTKKLRTRMIKHNMLPLMRDPISIDTLKQARKYFGFTSNRLDYLGEFLDVGTKSKHTSGLWIDVLKHDIYGKGLEAVKAIEKYNKGDIRLQEAVYRKMLPWMDNPTGVKGLICNNNLCGSIHLNKMGTRANISGNRYQRYQCQDCGRWMTDSKLKGESKLR